MSTELGLGDVLAQAQARLAEQPTETPVLRDYEEARRILRLVAETYGHDADTVIANFDEGGALADLVCAVLQICSQDTGARRPAPQARTRPGAPRQDETLRSYARIEVLRRSGYSLNQAVIQHTDELNAEAERTKTPGEQPKYFEVDTIRKRHDRWRKRRSGTIAALYGLISGVVR